MKPLPGRVIISYIFDYVIIIAFALGFAALDKVKPFNQHFSLRNYTLQYPYKLTDTVPISQAFVYVVVIPVIVMIIWTFLIDGLFSHPHPHRKMYGSAGGKTGWWGHTLKDRLWQLNCGILGLLLAVSGALVVTQILKNVTGKPRPDMIARCKPNVFEDPPVYGLSNSSICTETSKAIMWDAFRSWPSGHTTTSFAGLGFFSFYIAGKLHISDTRGEVWKTILVIFPLVGASLIAVSRIKDARHHPFDVVSGAFIGFFFGWAAYRQYFPSLSETWKKGRAHPIRSWGKDAADAKTDDREEEIQAKSDKELSGGSTALHDVEGTLSTGHTTSGSATSRMLAGQKGYVPPRSAESSASFDAESSGPLRGDRSTESYEMLTQSKIGI